MTELNLQNPDFIKRIILLNINWHYITVLYLDDKRGIHAVKRVYSRNKILDKNQHWFTEMNRKVTTFNEI